MELREFFTKNPSAAIALSGGADSAYLLYAAKKYGEDIKAYYVKTQFQPAFELADAKRLSSELDADLEVIEADILSEEEITKNSENRCYYCKKRIFNLIRSHALSDGYELILDGTNASDSEEDRAGMKALSELAVRSPLRECGLTKDRIRERSREAGLFTWDKPAYACLATRIGAGERITAQMLKRVENAEDFLFSLGFTDFRVRVFNGAAHIQLPPEQMLRAVKMREQICAELKPYFDIALLDLEGR